MNEVVKNTLYHLRSEHPIVDGVGLLSNEINADIIVYASKSSHYPLMSTIYVALHVNANSYIPCMHVYWQNYEQ